MSFPLDLTQILLPTTPLSSGIQVGDSLPALTLKDQHDQLQQIDSDSGYLIFSADKDASNLADAILEGQTEATLANARVCYVADISRMPSMVTTMFALPKLRKRPYPVALGRTAEQTQHLPRQAAKVTFIETSGGKIMAIDFLDDPVAVRARLGI